MKKYENACAKQTLQTVAFLKGWKGVSNWGYVYVKALFNTAYRFQNININRGLWLLPVLKLDDDWSSVEVVEFEGIVKNLGRSCQWNQVGENAQIVAISQTQNFGFGHLRRQNLHLGRHGFVRSWNFLNVFRIHLPESEDRVGVAAVQRPDVKRPSESRDRDVGRGHLLKMKEQIKMCKIIQVSTVSIR